MHTLTSLLRSKTSLAITLVLLASTSLIFLASAQLRAFQLLQQGRPTQMR